MSEWIYSHSLHNCNKSYQSRIEVNAIVTLSCIDVRIDGDVKLRMWLFDRLGSKTGRQCHARRWL